VLGKRAATLHGHRIWLCLFRDREDAPVQIGDLLQLSTPTGSVVVPRTVPTGTNRVAQGTRMECGQPCVAHCRCMTRESARCMLARRTATAPRRSLLSVDSALGGSSLDTSGRFAIDQSFVCRPASSFSDVQVASLRAALPTAVSLVSVEGRDASPVMLSVVVAFGLQRCARASLQTARAHLWAHRSYCTCRVKRCIACNCAGRPTSLRR
jgi:hypothetical protein